VVQMKSATPAEAIINHLVKGISATRVTIMMIPMESAIPAEVITNPAVREVNAMAGWNA